MNAAAATTPRNGARLLAHALDAEGVDTINGTDWKVTYKAVTSSRLDANALKKALPDLAQQFTKTTTARRFCIA